jgi:uroporphyrin-III C-methyltransferase
MSQDPRPTYGRVTLLGAGPGAPDLITLRGLKALREAEVILYDALLDEAYQSLFPANAEAIAAGKRCGAHTLLQNETTALLIAKAKEGKRVVRLKGGDPFLFGRGGEEAQALRDEGIPVDVIPGVSALQGAASAAGLPLTHRGLSREIRVLEGHGLLEESRNWFELAEAASRSTLAVFMGTRRIAELADRLLVFGADPHLPIALVEAAHCTGQTVTRATLQAAANGQLKPATDGPGLLYLGPTAALDLLSPQDTHAPSALPRSEGQGRAPSGRRIRRAG